MISSSFPAKNALMVYDSSSGYYRPYTDNDSISSIDRSPLDEFITASKVFYINSQSTYGVSKLTEESGVAFGSTIIENSGLLKLETANQTGSNVYLQTIKRGITHCASNNEALLNVNIHSSPTGNQYSRWGYFDGVNGVGYGYDQSGLYVFKAINSSYEKIYRQNWGLNTLSGDNNNYNGFNPINSIYCYGVNISNDNLENFIVVKNSELNKKQRVTVHDWDDASLIDRNQPLRIEAGNAQSVGQLSCSIGNKTYSMLGGEINITRRPMVAYISKYTMTSSENQWVPILAARRKATFGPSNRTNSVNVRLHGLSLLSDQDSEFMITIGANVTGTNWVTPDFRSPNDTVTEVQKITNNNLGVSVTGEIIDHESLFASNKQDSSIGGQELSYFGNGGELVLFARKTTANTTIISATLHWDEEY